MGKAVYEWATIRSVQALPDVRAFSRNDLPKRREGRRGPPRRLGFAAADINLSRPVV